MNSRQPISATGKEDFARRFIRYAWGVITRPRPTFEALANETSVRWAAVVVGVGVGQVWINMALFAFFGYDWLGSKPLLADPTYVGGFGYWRVPADQWLPIFAALMPAFALYGLVVVPGVVHLLGKLWGGRGTYEQMVNVLTFATVPSVLIAWLSEWLTGVPLNLIAGEAYFYGAAMQGEFGPTIAIVWTIYAVAVYTVPWIWGLVLSVLGISRVQGIPWPAAVLNMLVGFSMTMLITTTFVR